MVSTRDINRNLATEKVGIVFYIVKEKDGQRMLKPLDFETSISLKMVRAILDDTIIDSFYQTLARNLRERGVPDGSKVQLRAKFSPGHAMLDPQLSGTKILCEVDV